MDRQKYYVSVQAKTIMAQQGDAAYEFEIMANQEELNRLNALFRRMMDFDGDAYILTHLPGIPYHNDEPNDGFDYYLREIYNTLYELGTEETKDHIAEMNMLH
ncbi:hypothetical protein [Paenibacillus sp. GCM10027626]|uniref:hypothetical protein n=1 Tax=Paenibacillus sp. GCM10027626 TaxID=3273411 RepID=UPI0036392AF3